MSVGDTSDEVHTDCGAGCYGSGEWMEDRGQFEPLTAEEEYELDQAANLVY